MSEIKHKTELTADGYEKIEAKIQKIEDIANNAVFSKVGISSSFQQITLEAKQLRQILREVLIIVPAAAPASGGGEAA
ncbi:MAG: hypothetical protein FWB73_03055 [Treponema sp.]|nr:hypothetical protein [Treponema sp.]